MIPDRLRAALDAMRGRTVVVLGDLMLDEYVWGDVRRISPDAPVQVVDVRRRSRAIGGAANVAHNLAAAGANVRLVGAVGSDEAGRLLSTEVAAAGLDAGRIVTLDRRTTVKTRVVARGQHLLRLDEEQRAPLSKAEQQRLDAALREALRDADALLVSDYAKGVVSRATLASCVAIVGRKSIPIVVDPKSSDLSTYAGCTAITPNRGEAEAGTGLVIEDDPSLEAAANRIRELCGARDVLITLGERGLAVATEGRPVARIAAQAREVYDVTGAGDTVLAYFGLGLAAGLSAREAAEIANVAAGVKVGKVGTSAIAPSEVLALGEPGSLARKLVDLSQAVARCERWRSLGRRVVFTNGCFDLLHAGHIHLLEKARELGDVLVVALNSDASVRRLKGPERPLTGEHDRVRVISALDAVDLVLVFDEDTPLETIRRLHPDVLVKGGDYSLETIVGAELVREAGGRVETIPLVPGRSTTALVDKVKTRSE